MRVIRTAIRSYYSRSRGWIARKVFYTSGSTHYAISSGRVGYTSQNAANIAAEKFEWKR